MFSFDSFDVDLQGSVSVMLYGTSSDLGVCPGLRGGLALYQERRAVAPAELVKVFRGMTKI